MNGGGGGGGGDDDDDADLQRALALSMMETTAAPPPVAAAAASAHNHNINDDDNDEDADLAAALQLSLQQASGGDKDDDQVMKSVETTSMDEPRKKPAASSSSSQVEPIIPTVDLAELQRKNARVGLWYQTAQPTNILNCHYILWDDGITTTRNDQQRWLAQSIDFKSSRGAPQTATTASTSKNPDGQAQAHAQASSSIHPGADETVLGAIICHSERWGLTQAHGGPCGVLASIQAELMRLLLFGPRIHDGDGDGASASSGGNTVLLPVHIPTQLTNHFCQAKPDLSPSFLTSALALSIGMVLARAALQPSATQNDHSHENENENEKGEQDTNNIMVDNEEESPASSTSRRPAVVKLVFPKPRPNIDDKSSSSSSWASSPYASRQLDWHHLAPWTSKNDPTASDSANASGLSDHLVTYTISLEEEEPQQESSTTTSSTAAASTTITTPTNNDDEESSKRQKRFRKNTPTSSSSTSSPQRRDHSPSEQQQHETPMSSSREELLAQAVAEFLLETKLMESWYHRQGGVLLFVLALVESRGVAHIQGDMDDPTAKLTSQFGHCSQELINLLLTGQAVSNVFDNTLRPSGELICRGIQKRPVIGYLSQLESMRYVEVGGYYKRPQFPIWVVGSTSHFTLLFGDATCLYESQSDRILERVRRAFKQMDGGEEQGFIQLDQLGDFLRKLDLYETLGDHGVQALGATMEVHGAGILLWEDVWKRTSRLLTGASLETVLNMDEGTTTTNANNNVSSFGGYGGGNTSSTALVPSAASSLSSTRASLEAGSSVPPPLMPAMLADDNFNYNDNDLNAPPPMTDEEYARLLQAEWNGDLLPTPTPLPAPAPLPTAITTTTTTPSNSNHNHNHNQHNNSGQKETFGTTFQLYHYNGLRGGYMKPFRVTRLSAEEAIGTSVALGVNHAQSGGGGASRGGATMSANYQEGGLEDVLRTKWPSCKIDWLHGGSPPSID